MFAPGRKERGLCQDHTVQNDIREVLETNFGFSWSVFGNSRQIQYGDLCGLYSYEFFLNGFYTSGDKSLVEEENRNAL